MKRVLITGAGSYVGTHVMHRLQEEPETYFVQELDVKGDDWKDFDFSGFDSVFHVAGIAHVSTDPSMEPLYMQVNRDLAIDVAKHAKAVGVKQFIFMSSSIVYGDSVSAGKGKPITLDTPPNPANFYGRSKLEAEEGLRRLEDGIFAVAVIRAPMIFGPNAKGNFPKLVSMSRKLPLFPKVDNRRSMLYVENLAELVACLISNSSNGAFFPQEEEWITTSSLVRLISNVAGHPVHLTKLFNPILCGPLKRQALVLKAFGDLYYEESLSEYGFVYRRYSINEAIERIATEEGWH
ncbi:MAG TPA: NAD-dependent epimerase/dehydratase family protein, partial [Slackia equolifaciens]|nr:NAD-dependent epimerase/dehydratase family protein [Slackia equolifaciens]